MGAATAAASALGVEEATTIEELERLRGQWLELWRRCPQATPFQSPAWLIAWWKHLGQGQLWVLALRQEQRLVGVVPCVVAAPAPGPERRLLLLGTGLSDYLDALLEPEVAGPACAALLAWLEAGHYGWDVCDWQQLPGNSPLLEAELPPGWRCRRTAQEVCPVLTLPGQVEQLPAMLPSHMANNLRYYRRRLERLRQVKVELADPENFSELLENFLKLHRARWAARGQDGVLAQERLQAFHREAARDLLACGALRLYELRIAGRLAASLYAFSHGARVFYYLCGAEPDFATLSPGTLLIGHAIEQAIRQGQREFDFLRGREAYKFLWGAKARPNYRCQWWPR